MKRSIVFTCSLLLAFTSIRAQATAYFRLATTNASPELVFSADGFLIWSNFPLQSPFAVERATNLATGAWEPWTRGTSVSSVVAIKVTDFSPPTNMVYIPAGYFTVGDTLGDNGGVAVPVHQAYVSGFFMQKYEVSNDQARRVFQWAYDQAKVSVTSTNVVNTVGTVEPLLLLNKWDSEIGFTNGIFTIRSGREDHPCAYITWYGAVAYCEFLNEMESLQSAYDLTNWTCDFNSDGYRLPTETEWERAARGGWEGHRFPWSDTDTISHSRANYKSSTNNVYDLGPTWGYNPLGGPGSPYSTPVGTFAPNSYGLYDMSGNVWEWCWDWAGKYPSTTQINPTGPATGTYRVFRGGSWLTTAERLTCAVRYLSFDPTRAYDDIGLRPVRRIP